jgi:glycosyltransferase involved in cell wall biosynthesis
VEGERESSANGGGARVSRPEGGVDVTIVVPVYNNAQTLDELCRRMVRVMEARGGSFEVIFVDDGSRDDSWEILMKLGRADARVRTLRLARNFGQPAALCAGLERMKGEAVVTIDADLQNFPEDIPKLLDEIERGHDLVSGYRVNRNDPLFTRRLPSRFLNLLVRFVTGVKLRDYGCGLNAARVHVARAIKHHGEMRRFVKPLAVLLAGSVSEVPVQHVKRDQGGSTYSFSSLVGVQFDFFTSFSRKPFQVIGLAGVFFFVVGFLGGVTYLVLRFGAHIGPDIRVQALLLLAMVLGLQLSVLGLLGEFILRVYHLTQGQPFYVVREE